MVDTSSPPLRGFVAPADVILPAQFFDTLRRRWVIQGERRLMVAILEDAVECVQKHLLARRRGERRIFTEAYDWISSDSTEPFSFQHACDIVELDPTYIRDGLDRWCRAHLTHTKPRCAPHHAA